MFWKSLVQDSATTLSLLLFLCVLCVAPDASPLALASPFGIRGDAARTSRQSRPTHWLLCGSFFLNFALIPVDKNPQQKSTITQVKKVVAC
ncbi:hypothetical protein [Nostoc favosum]|uniref:Secreted protein n=1 Tax=Nostoc favosum CHAB5714 TaxID=2780399 RepID=A0ABS8IH86_9NOSO|nr:hypothetical protein [Nostoc favosum]MCC5603610.1 hypothetical protein [Nostoc favosum CHAB5714]